MVRVGLIGTGLMGKSMVERLVTGGFPVVAYNRTIAKLTALEELGALITDSIRTVISQSDVLILMLSDAAAIEEVLLQNTTIPLLNQKTVIQMATISPRESRDIQHKITTVGGYYLEAPVLGSIPEVKKGELQVMVGSSEDQFQQWLPLLQRFSLVPQWIGEVGTAAALKLALNQLIAALTASFALSLKLVQAEDVDLEKFMSILRQSALYAPTFDKKLTRMVGSDYDNPNFPTKHLLKDINLFLDTAHEAGLDGSSLVGVKALVEKAIAQGWAEGDYSAVAEGIKLANSSIS